VQRCLRVAARRSVESPASYKTTLINPVNDGGWLYQACHSVSDLDVNVTYFPGTGLILYESHSDGMPPSNDNPKT
jgi:hypothetical protein